MRNFWKDESGNFAMMTAITCVPLIAGIALGIDYSAMTRQRAIVQAAIDASGIATAKRIAAGADDATVKAYAVNFFKANLGKLDASSASLDVVMPEQNAATGALKLTGRLAYKPYLAGSFAALLGKPAAASYPIVATAEIRLKNTLEVALVLDNSGSMAYLGKNSAKQRIELLKDAAEELVDTMAAQANLMTQVPQPVRFSLVPFAGSVNVGSGNKTASWMDTAGLSPVHHENFDWTTGFSGNKTVESVGNQRFARGTGWGALKDQPLTRFTLFDSLQRTVAGKTVPASAWSGCVESRPYPYNVDDAAPSTGKPETLFVPMFAPDETDQKDGYGRPANNNWWADGSSAGDLARQKNAAKYFTTAASTSFVAATFLGDDLGPNSGCSTKPITSLTDVTVPAGMKLIKGAIDDMQPNGATNVPEGMAWGWRTISSGAPFTEGRPETERGNDKVVIVLTDGENTYYGPTTIQANAYSGLGFASGGNDLAGNKSIYSAYGYTGTSYAGSTRLFANTSSAVGKTTYTNANYTKALNEQFDTLCGNSAFVKLSADKKTRTGQVVVMTIALDLDANDATEKAQIEELKACASPSKVTPGKILFWNATGATLNIVFKDIANELSNLRIVG